MAKSKNKKYGFIWWIAAIIGALISAFYIGKYFKTKKAQGVDTGSNSFDSSSGGLSRGIRNKNPLNIRNNVNNNWVGLSSNNPDNKGFCIFTDAKYGYRAAHKIMKSYSNRGILRVFDVISTWAPSSDGNHPENYFQTVKGIMYNKFNIVIDMQSTVNLNDIQFMEALFYGMSISENGWGMEKKISQNSIIQGLNLAM